MIKPPLVVFIATALFSTLLPDAGAQSVSEAADKEVARRAELVTRAKVAISEGEKAYKNGNYDVAFAAYQSACDTISEGPITHDLRASAIDGLSRTSVKVAEEYISKKDFMYAHGVLANLLQKKYAPDYQPALDLSARLVDPDAPFYKNAANKDELVKILFVEARNFSVTKQYELAYQSYTKILHIEPSNRAAAQGKYYTRPPEKVVSNPDPKGITSHPKNEYIEWKLKNLIIAKVDFKEIPLREALELLKKKSYELDTEETYLAHRGVNIYLKLDSDASPTVPQGHTPVDDVKITLSLSNIPIGLALEYIAKLVSLKVRVEPFAVAIVPASLNDMHSETPAAIPDKPRYVDVIQKKLDTLIIPKIDFKEATVREAVEFLKKKSAEVDTEEPNPARKGVNIFLKLEPTSDSDNPPHASSPADIKINLSVENVPLGQALKYVTSLAALKVKVEPYGVTLVPLGGVIEEDDIITKDYIVPAGFFTTTKAAEESPVTPGTKTPPDKSKLMEASDYLKQAGVKFPPGASANYIPASRKLVVHNTKENLELVDKIMASLIAPKVETKKEN